MKIFFIIRTHRPGMFAEVCYKTEIFIDSKDYLMI